LRTRPLRDQTHDYERKGTTNLFTAMSVHTGEIVYTFHPRHRYEVWIQFLSLIESATPPGKEIHLIMDNYSARTPPVGLWLAEHRRFHIYWTPTGGSWLNVVERLFSDVTQKMPATPLRGIGAGIGASNWRVFDSAEREPQTSEVESHRHGDLAQNQARLGDFARPLWGRETLRFAGQS